MEKECKTCKKVKDISEFYEKECMSDGYVSFCKACVSIYNKSYKKKVVYKKLIRKKKTTGALISKELRKITSQPAYKKCLSCGKIKYITDFYKNKTMKDGYRKSCKECSKSYQLKMYKGKRHLTICDLLTMLNLFIIFSFSFCLIHNNHYT